MLRMFAMIFKCFKVFLQVFQMHVSSVLSVFFYILQVLYLDVLKINRVLHIGCAWEVGGGASGTRAGARNTDTGGQCPGNVGPDMDVRKQVRGNRLQSRASEYLFLFSCDSWTLKLDQIAMDPWNIG
jgi:hypothetical protein